MGYGESMFKRFWTEASIENPEVRMATSGPSMARNIEIQACSVNYKRGSVQIADACSNRSSLVQRLGAAKISGSESLFADYRGVKK